MNEFLGLEILVWGRTSTPLILVSLVCQPSTVSTFGSRNRQSDRERVDRE